MMKKRPLEGVKVLDFSQVLAAPFCGMMLADLGAEVIKIERPGMGDISREFGPYVNDVSLYFCQYNRGKKGLALDMSSEEGKKVVMDLVKEVDVVIENYKSGTLEKLGLGYEEMIKVNPELIYGSVAGFGTHGPLSHLPCMDIIAASRSGLVAQTGIHGDSPIKPGFSLCDTWAGLNLLRGLSMALIQKQATGKGSRIDIAMLDAAFYMCEPALIEYSTNGDFTKRTGNQDPWFAPCGQFKAIDGTFVVDVKTENEWEAFCNALGMNELKANPLFETNALRVENRNLLIEEIEKVTITLEKYEIEKALIGKSVPSSVVQTMGEFINSPQTKELDIIVEIDQPFVGRYMAVNTPIKFSKTPVSPYAEAASFPGSHSREVLNNLGYSEEKINALLESGAISQAVYYSEDKTSSLIESGAVS